MLRTHTCGELNAKQIAKEVSLAGWVHKRRDHGEIIFIDVRDAYGVTQLVFDPKENRQMHKKAHELKSEYVIRAKGVVRKRPDGTVNTKIPTGEVEILVSALLILNPSETPPFEIDDSIAVSDEMRLKYRYIDLRRPRMQKNMRLRHKTNTSIRNFLEKRNFVEIETPFLTRSTPEGARDYLVPSRLNIGKFYALPQSPQLFKQILMVSGFDRYFQIARCFRDEDLRKDRQPEFTQLDLEMSFVDENDIFALSEGLMKAIFKEVSGIDIPTPFTRLMYHEAMERFGTDKPDARFGMELANLSEVLKNTKFNVFKKTLEKEGSIYAINAKGYAKISRSKLDGFIAKAKDLGAMGLAYFKCENAKLSSNIDKFFEKNELDSIKNKTRAEENDLVLIVADKKSIAQSVLGSMRLEIAAESGIIDDKKINFFWITDFPLFKYNEEEKRWESEHHPFTACKEEDIKLLDGKNLEKIHARSYDLVINGQEIASGSIRIHKRDFQEKIFKTIGIGVAEAKKRFGFLIEAFKYGAPPHGGIAFGLDRFVTIFTKSSTIRDVIAFPKTQKAIGLMTGAPSDVDDKQLKELHIKKVK
ncbi:MAG: aspartate--tRNA ligase [Candidatus Omnitrophica bacterium]|nr:aspartate--tRNA ligase [Candidatus Omnitrophota bacterium]